jgi:hypothetical protein
VAVKRLGSKVNEMKVWEEEKKVAEFLSHFSIKGEVFSLFVEHYQNPRFFYDESATQLTSLRFYDRAGICSLFSLFYERNDDERQLQ